MTLFENLYDLVFVACYESEGDGDGDGGSETTPPSQETVSGNPGGNTGEKFFTQDEVNRIAAENKRNLQKKLEEVEKSRETLEASYKAVLESKSLQEEERERLEKSMSDLQKQFKTKEQVLAEEKKKAEEEARTAYENLAKEKDLWQNRFTTSTIESALINAGVKHDAYNPKQIVTQLFSQTKLVDQLDGNGKPTGKLVPMVEMVVTNEDTEQPEVLQMSPEDAVAQLKKDELWANLFKNNIREGIGSSSTTGDVSGNGKVDQRKITTEQYMKLRKENPEALGLNSTRDPWLK